MRALVTVASRHGATAEIGQVIAETLKDSGIEVDVIPPERVESMAGYDAVVIGSGLYLGRWLATAREFVTAHADDLRKLPVWLFASGHLSNLAVEGDVAEGLTLQQLIGARDNRVFAGQLKKEGLSVFERVSVSMIKSPWGDYRPWDAIRDWAASIGKAVNTPLTPVR
jgi:menaquinone-dependent protoporphyrinogen oxidase